MDIWGDIMAISPSQVQDDDFRNLRHLVKTIVKFEKYIDQGIKSRADAGAKPPYEITIDFETFGIGHYHSNLIRQDFDLVTHRIESNYKNSGWGDVSCRTSERQFIVRLLTAENVAEEGKTKRQQSSNGHRFIALLKKFIRRSQQ